MNSKPNSKDVTVALPKSYGKEASWRELLTTSLEKSITLLIFSALLGFLVNFFANENQQGYAKIARLLTSHACDTGFAFPVMALGICALCLGMLSHAQLGKPVSVLGENIISLLSHLILAGLGFAIANSSKYNLMTVIYWVLLIGWFVLGFISVLMSKLVTQKVTWSKASETRDAVICLALLIFGAFLLSSVVDKVTEYNFLSGELICKPH